MCGFLLLLSKFTFVKAGSARSHRFDHARIERVHTDFPGGKLLGMRNRYGVSLRALLAIVSGRLSAGIDPTMEPMLTIEPPSGPH
jgi:hypothetical protein